MSIRSVTGQPLRVEVVDEEREVHRAFARPAARRRDRREVRRRQTEVDLGWRRPAERLMRAKMRIVDETELDRRGEVFRN